MGEVVRALVTEDMLNPGSYRDLVAHHQAGAVVLFSGDVRDNDQNKAVETLTYEAHPTAQDVLQKIADEVSKKYDLIKIALAHRHGPIPIGECAFVVAVSAKHRAESFSACSYLVDEVKKQIPIWKHQVFADGSDEWVNYA
jgi:molybdopterin synthase catalytic subunit